MNTEYHVVQPMKYAVARHQRILDEALASNNYGLELKLDGSSYVLARDLDGTIHLYGDRISKKTGTVIDKIDNVPHLREFAEQHFPNGSQLIVEITCLYNWSANKWEKRSSSKYVNSIMLSSPSKAVSRQEMTKPCGAYIFDILFWDNKPLFQEDFIDRYHFLEELKAKWDCPEWLTFAELYIDNKDEKIAEWIANGEEGGVLKMLHSTDKISAAHAVTEIGETPKRPMHTTYKIKQVSTIDVVIMGIQYPDKTYTGKNPETYLYRDEDNNPVNRLWALDMVNGFEIGLFNNSSDLVKIGTVASGLDDDMRHDAFLNPEAYLNQVIEVDCMSIDKAGHSLRHPRLMKMRPDKAPEHCLYGEVFP